MDFARAKLPEGEKADALVERALFLAATGYFYTEEKRETTDKGGEKITRTRKQAAPSVSAIALWLSHRMPDKWGDGAAVTAENNLLTLLRQDLEGGDRDGISELQSQATAGPDLVEPAGDDGAGRRAV